LCDGAICEHDFAMVFVVILHENRIQRRFRELETPFIAAMHAVGVRRYAG